MEEERELIGLVQLCSRSAIILWRKREKELVALVQLCSRSAISLWRKRAGCFSSVMF